MYRHDHTLRRIPPGKSRRIRILDNNLQHLKASESRKGTDWYRNYLGHTVHVIAKVSRRLFLTISYHSAGNPSSNLTTHTLFRLSTVRSSECTFGISPRRSELSSGTKSFGPLHVHKKQFSRYDFTNGAARSSVLHYT